ncbi:MAG: aromatic amino acid transport family protein [bacterium]|nr:aromatic amino acid transport family protein [bacterium]
MFKNIILPASLLAGTIIGAGVFALPYVFIRAGVLTGLFYLIIFSAVFTLIHLMYADIILRTKENRRFFGYAEIYLGSWGKWSAILTTIVGMIFILTVYLILSVSFFNLIPQNIVLPDIYKILIFWLFGSLAVFMGINRLAIAEFLITFGIAGIILIIFGYGFGDMGQAVSISSFDLKYLFLPYGAVLFSLAGRTAIPALLGYFRNNNQPQLKAKIPIILGSLAPALIYSIFVFGILSLSETVSQDSISGLIGRLPPSILGLLGGLGLISLWSSYIVIGRDVKKSFEHDFNFPQIFSGLIIVLSPLFLYFLGFQNFLKLVGLIGGVFIGLESVFIILMWLKARKSGDEERGVFLQKMNPLIIYALLLIFVGGIIYEIAY